ncbi:hypothetical protein BT63DRAFT_457810 [Microthyrium microscopicum]|uniref:Ecp2 effector protein domain-containing protein n=1 Tax=Microthyrium microscopicum TaxID=703497 RepID=A0A6A6U3X7_9PEZI|nr:hypothetical protein BT63DRAFT_457810 [Microthyrium microscopicum]
MRFFTIFTVSLGMVGSAVASPFNATYQSSSALEAAVQKLTTIHGPANLTAVKAALGYYGVICNQNKLNKNDIGACYDILQDKKDRTFYVGVSGKGKGDFCHFNDVYFSGIGWSDNGGRGTGEAPGVQCVVAYATIIYYCGFSGGSVGTFQSADNDLVVHMTDHWVI